MDLPAFPGRRELRTDFETVDTASMGKIHPKCQRPDLEPFLDPSLHCVDLTWERKWALIYSLCFVLFLFVPSPCAQTRGLLHSKLAFLCT